jgi:probable F420-dependent oxidoreductase
MKFGVHVFPTETSIQPDELARAAEERGLDSVWFSEHSHIPVRFLNAPDGTFRLPDYYWQTYDIFVAMTLAAAATKTIRVASGVALVIERDPIFLAKEAATIDLVSKGRFVFGVGAGWLESEMSDHGVEYRTRFQLLREQLQAIQEIWANDESEFHGRFVNFDKMKAFPKPYQKPRPPIVMGGSGEKALACAAELCDGWAPWMLEWSKAKPLIDDLRRRAIEFGRDPHSLEVSLFEGELPDEKVLAEMEQAGVKRIILTIFGQSREDALPQLDEIGRLVR